MHQKMGKGVTLTREETYELYLALANIFGKKSNIKIDSDDIIELAKD